MALIDEAVAAGARQDKACEMLGLDERTVQRWRGRLDEGNEKGDLRRGPKTKPANALTDEEWAQVRAMATAPEFVDLTPHELVPKLADMGTYIASESSFYRELRRAKLLTHRQRSRPRKHQKPVEFVATGPNQAWAWDITFLPAGVVGTYYYLYAVLDAWSRKMVAWAVYEAQTDELSAPLIAAACEREGVLAGELRLHADNGGAMKGKTMLVKLQELGVVPSFSRPSVSDDNPFPEALFRRLKYRPSYPDGRFASLDEARLWVERFVAWYNEDHQHSGIRFVTPAQRHAGQDEAILAGRDQVYRRARARRPERWSGGTRNWSPVNEVRLHPGRQPRRSDDDGPAAARATRADRSAGRPVPVATRVPTPAAREDRTARAVTSEPPNHVMPARTGTTWQSLNRHQAAC